MNIERSEGIKIRNTNEQIMNLYIKIVETVSDRH